MEYDINEKLRQVGASELNDVLCKQEITPEEQAEWDRREEVIIKICKAVCVVEGLDPDEPEQEYESEAHANRDGPSKWVRYYDAVAEALDSCAVLRVGCLTHNAALTDGPETETSKHE